MPFTHLSQSYKGRFPFTLAAPSFIYPADYTTNVKHLAPYLDQIELLFFDSARKRDLPDRALIQQLIVLARDLDISYNVHLPTDIDPGSPDMETRQKALATLQTMIALTQELQPSTYTLHLPFDHSVNGDIHARCQRLEETLPDLLPDGVDSRKITIENLHYPFEWVDRIIRAFDFSVCLDCGHLFLMGLEPEKMFNQHQDRITTLHIHGAANGRDHLALNWLNEFQIDGLMRILARFNGVVSVEVFSFTRLQSSLEILGKHF